MVSLRARARNSYRAVLANLSMCESLLSLPVILSVFLAVLLTQSEDSITLT
jgi:hypothetical protein